MPTGGSLWSAARDELPPGALGTGRDREGAWRAGRRGRHRQDPAGRSCSTARGRGRVHRLRRAGPRRRRPVRALGRAAARPRRRIPPPPAGRPGRGTPAASLAPRAARPRARPPAPVGRPSSSARGCSRRRGAVERIAGDAPSRWLFEDVHLADAASIELARLVPRRIGTLPVCSSSRGSIPPQRARRRARAGGAQRAASAQSRSTSRRSGTASSPTWSGPVTALDDPRGRPRRRDGGATGSWPSRPRARCATAPSARARAPPDSSARRHGARPQHHRAGRAAAIADGDLDRAELDALDHGDYALAQALDNEYFAPAATGASATTMPCSTRPAPRTCRRSAAPSCTPSTRSPARARPANRPMHCGLRHRPTTSHRRAGARGRRSLGGERAERQPRPFCAGAVELAAGERTRWLRLSRGRGLARHPRARARGVRPRPGAARPAPMRARLGQGVDTGAPGDRCSLHDPLAPSTMPPATASRCSASSAEGGAPMRGRGGRVAVLVRRPSPRRGRAGAAPVGALPRAPACSLAVSCSPTHPASVSAAGCRGGQAGKSWPESGGPWPRGQERPELSSAASFDLVSASCATAPGVGFPRALRLHLSPGCRRQGRPASGRLPAPPRSPRARVRPRPHRPPTPSPTQPPAEGRGLRAARRRPRACHHRQPTPAGARAPPPRSRRGGRAGCQLAVEISAEVSRPLALGARAEARARTGGSRRPTPSCARRSLDPAAPRRPA